MNLSESGEHLLENAEGRRKMAYCDKCGANWGLCDRAKCSGGHATIGIGHLILPDEMKLYVGVILTDTTVESLFRHDIKPAEDAVNHGLKVPLRQNRFDACVVLAFNIGTGAFLGSTLLRDINDLRPMDEIQHEWMRWCHDKFGIVPGLQSRREVEFALFKQ